MTREITVPLVGTPSYIADLLLCRLRTVWPRPIPSAPVPLLQVLLRHALLREYAEAAARGRSTAQRGAAARRRTGDLRDRVQVADAETWSCVRAQPVTGGDCAHALAADPNSPQLRAGAQDARDDRRAALERHLRGDAGRDVASARRVGHIARHRRLTEIRATSTPNGV